MSNDLAVVGDNAVAINKLFGFDSTFERDIPVLRIEGADDEEGIVKAPKGTFVYDDGKTLLYCPEVHFRAYVQTYQYRLYDKDNRENNDMSIIGKDFKTEYRSTSGRIACGKLSKKRLQGVELTPAQQFYQDNAKCKLIIFGVASGEFTNVDTKEKTKVEDGLCVWTVSQAAFMSIAETLKGIEKERRPIPLTPIRLSLKREKNGQVTYYVPIPHVETRTAKFVVERDQEYLGRITKYIKDTNDFVNNKYQEAVKAHSENDNFAAVAPTVATGADPLDLDDVVPF